MNLPNEETEALRACARILAPLMTPAERAAMTRNIEGAIRSGEVNLLFKLDHIAVLIFPSDSKRAHALAEAMRVAKTTGALPSEVRRHPDRGLIRELVAWPDCPKIPDESPLRYWVPRSMHERRLTVGTRKTVSGLYSKEDFLALIASKFDKHESPHARLHWHVVRDDGVYVHRATDDERRHGIDDNPVEHPTGDPNVPALPFPFALGQFLAFEATARVVNEMSDEEIEALVTRNEMAAWELAHAARDAERALSAGGESPARAAAGYLPDGRPFYTVAEAVEVTSAALYPHTDSGSVSKHDLAREVARQAHVAEFKSAADQREVEVLNPTTKTRHTMPSGDALMRALIARDELQRFARKRLRIELRVRSSVRHDERQAVAASEVARGGRAANETLSAPIDVPSDRPENVVLGAKAWRALARREALEYILSHDGREWTAGSVGDVANHIAGDWRARNVCGPHGTPTGATIKRHALSGILDDAMRLRSARGKRGK